MALTTTKDIIEVSGLGTRVTNENVGTGDNATEDFDLDHQHIIANTYKLYYGAAGSPASNDMTDLTETTHYTLDIESGRIRLTQAGVVELGTNILYADYTFQDDLTDNQISGFIANADKEVERVTGRLWEDQSITEYHDGRPRANYPSTDRPYSEDADALPFVMMQNYPVRYLESVHFLVRGQPLSQVWSYDDSATSYTDNTDNANDAEENDFSPFNATPAVGDILYVGSAYKFLSLQTVLTTVGAGGSAAVTWEYWNGAAWTAMTVTDEVSGASTLTASGRFYWSALSNWAKVSVNNSAQYYYVRGRLTGLYTTDPVCREVFMGQDDVIAQTLSLRSLDVAEYGRVTFLTNSIPYGERNVKIAARVGYTSSNIPADVKELSALYGALRCFTALTGGSYNDETSFSLGSKEVTIGEVYVNVAEVVKQFKERIENLKANIGERAHLEVT